MRITTPTSPCVTPHSSYITNKNRLRSSKTPIAEFYQQCLREPSSNSGDQDLSPNWPVLFPMKLP